MPFNVLIIPIFFPCSLWELLHSFFFPPLICIKTLHIYQRVLTSACSQGWLNGQSMDKSTWQIHFTIWHSWHSLLKFSSEINLYGNCTDAECRSVHIASLCPGNDLSYGCWWCSDFCITLSDESRYKGSFAECFARECALVDIFVVLRNLLSVFSHWALNTYKV